MKISEAISVLLSEMDKYGDLPVVSPCDDLGARCAAPLIEVGDMFVSGNDFVECGSGVKVNVLRIGGI